MAANRTIDSRIAALTDALLADYRLGRPIDRIGPCAQPDREVIVALIGKLKRLLFPGYFSDPASRVDGMSQPLTALMEDVAYQLGQQIAIALGVGAGVPDAQARLLDSQAQELTVRFLEQLPAVRALLQTDLEAAFDGDPAARSLEEVLLAYPGWQAILIYRLAHGLHLLGVPLIPRVMTEHAHSATGIDIHPGAAIGRHFFIDHGTGVVIGETAIIGDDVKLYQSVTLGALSTRGGQSLRGQQRHPTIEDRVTIYAGASVLGGNTVIGHDAVIGGNAFITESVAPGMRVSVRNQELELRPGKASW